MLAFLFPIAVKSYVKFDDFPHTEFWIWICLATPLAFIAIVLIEKLKR